jgi:hypothetical protein
MAIRDKDGNIYKLRGPNPKMRDQSQWAKDRIVYINMDFGKTTEIVSDERNPIEKFKTNYNVLDVGEELNLVPNEEFDSNVAVIPREQNTDPPPPIDAMEQETPVERDPNQQVNITGVDEKMKRALQRNMIEFRCAPAIRKEYTDALYGETKIKTTYGNKFVFDGIIIAQNTFEIQFFSFKPITFGSIVFPVNQDKQWWRIEDVTPRTGGYVCKGMVSDVNPDFS